MKLRLPQSLVCALMAACGTAATLPSDAGDIISVNYYNSSFNITDQSGDVGGVSAAGWTNIAPANGNVSTTENLINQNAQATQNTYLTTLIQSGMWGNDQVNQSTVEGKLLRAYIDVSNHSTSHYYIDFASDYAVSSLTLYFSGDCAQFAPVEVNGTRYIGANGVASAIAADATDSWGDRTTTGSNTITNNNSFTLSGVAGGAYHLTNVYTGNNNRASLSGFQVTDLTDTLAWNATLASGTTSVENVQWEKASESVPAELAQALASVAASSDGSTLALGDSATYNVIQSTSGDLTLTGNNLTIHGLHAKESSKLTLNATLASTVTPTIGGYGTVVLGSNVAEASAKGILMNSPAPKTTLELNQKVTLSIGEATLFSGTLVVNNSDERAYNHGSQENTTGYDLVLNPAHSFDGTPNISSVSKVVLNNAGLYYAGNGTTINNLTLNANSDSNLKVEHMGGSANLVLAGNTSLAEGSCLTTVARWASRVQFDKLVGSGTLKLQGGVTNATDSSTYVINSLQGFTGSLVFDKASTNPLTATINTGTGSDVALSGLTMNGATVKGYTVTLSGSQVLSVSGTATLSGGTLKIAEGAKLEINKKGSLTDAQMTISGGNLESAGTLCVGRMSSGGGNLSMTSGSIKAKEILTAWGGNINLTGGTLEFTGGDEVSAIRKGSAQGGTPTASADVTFNGVTLKASSTAWKVDGQALSRLTIGSLTVSSDTQNSITIAHAKTDTAERTITNNSTGEGKLVLDSLEFAGRLNIGGAGTTEFVNGATLATAKTSDFSLVANTDVALKGATDGGEATYNLAGTDIAIQKDKTLSVTSGAKLTAKGIWYSSTGGSQYGRLAIDNGAGVSVTGELRVQGITNNGALTLTTNNDKTVGVYSQGSTGVLELGDNVSMTTAKANDGTIAGSYVLGEGAHLDIKQLGADVTASLQDLTLATNAVMGAYQGDTIEEASEANISVSGTLSTSSGANLNANLTMQGGSTLDVDYATGGLTMGSNVSFAGGEKMHLSESIIGGLNELIANQAFNTGLTLFSGVDRFNGSTDDFSTSASTYFDLNGVARPWDFVVKYETPAGSSSGGTISLWMETPEPATATLSLLALAALAARRKRK